MTLIDILEKTMPDPSHRSPPPADASLAASKPAPEPDIGSDAGAAAPYAAEPGPVAGGLSEAEIELTARQLRGVNFVDLRQYGGAPQIGTQVAAALAERGFSVSLNQLERMVPPPIRRVVIRYSGNRAEITLAPQVAEAPARNLF